MAHIKIRELLRAPDMAILILENKNTGEQEVRRVPPAIIDKYRQHPDGTRDTPLEDAWQEVPGFDANWRLAGYGEGAESTDTDTGWLELEADYYEQQNGDDPEDRFYILVNGVEYTYFKANFTITRDAQNRITIAEPMDGFTVTDGFLDY